MTEAAKESGAAAERQHQKDQLFKGVCVSTFLAVVAHTMNLQSEAILIRNACGNDLGLAVRVASASNAAAGLLGLVVNQIGGKLSDSFGRKMFFLAGPFVQFLTGICCFLKPDSAAVMAVFKALKICFTTFSGTVIGGAALRDTFQGTEMSVKAAKTGSVVGLAIMMGPLIESFILKWAKTGNERVTYLGLALLGLASMFVSTLTPESLAEEKKSAFDLSAALSNANPLAFVKLYLNGSPAVRKLASIVTLQTLSDGKNISDLTQTWVREHLKLSMESIRNFLMGYGFASFLAGAKLTPYMLTNLSVYGFTSFTNTTNFIAFCLRGSVENMWVFFGALPIMLPGVNASSTMALTPVLNDHLSACNFGVGESTAWVNNMRVLAGAAVTLTYGYFYAWCRKKGINAGLTFALSACLGAAIPQLLLMSTIKQSELETRKKQ